MRLVVSGLIFRVFLKLNINKIHNLKRGSVKVDKINGNIRLNTPLYYFGLSPFKSILSNCPSDPMDWDTF